MIREIRIRNGKPINPDEAQPGLYISDANEVLVRTHWGAEAAIKTSQWVNLEGTFHGVTPAIVYEAVIVYGEWTGTDEIHFKDYERTQSVKSVQREIEPEKVPAIAAGIRKVIESTKISNEAKRRRILGIPEDNIDIQAAT